MRSESEVSISTVFLGEYVGDDEKSLGILMGGSTSCMVGMNSAFVNDTIRLDLPTPSSPQITTRIVSLVIVLFNTLVFRSPLFLFSIFICLIYKFHSCFEGKPLYQMLKI
ncbi:hypothetical protein P301_A20136 [Saccharomyces cerevisiae P301]|uniref:Putative uncharacterized membrane protein YAL047W-A n=2 Tax=Saccharomyces cerevisiae TaxID=4932 RepID=YA047_YEAST|nr:RecName: Full=Putative uncharacterized membrane protein YAL047W-A [Saccharomyces cerevisiae S288C]AHX39252.1 hypothetical protein YAL047W-A [Saccharomyces cerevisiae]EWG87869.1 hypothetical protein R008_A10111 [Saccharomyces cerevisiae R008]EWG92633.1 hypothetical protein P301_A20136 [Saccharomyces cerevisiae P301]EWG97679.1 hypothetical protein R103_A10146 [Saccharomyces cerevisiae R103]UZT75928.1 hypothetical protein OPV43_180 [Saccharomyces cerevisiae synthetic construct]CAY77595.1 EC11